MSDTNPTAIEQELKRLERRLDELLRAVETSGYTEPTAIQAAAIPSVLMMRDLIGIAQTGTGKTAAFALPILHRLAANPKHRLKYATRTLVLAPTRELAIQVAEAFQKYASHIKDFHVLPIYGGQSYGPQLSALRRGVHVVVGTPGRMADVLENSYLVLNQCTYIVLDEADRLLDMGFEQTVLQIMTIIRGEKIAGLKEKMVIL